MRGDVTRALVPAIAENEMRQRACERFAGSELYSLAWIGRYRPENEEVLPTASAGLADEALDGFSTAGESPRAELTSEALRTGEVAVGRDFGTDPAAECRDYAQDCQATAAVPLVYEETAYGVLQLGTDRSQGFGATERESLEELGATIAYALESAKSPASADAAESPADSDGIERGEAEPAMRLTESE